MKRYIDRIDLHTYTEWYNYTINKSLIKVDDLLGKNKTGVVCVIECFNTSSFIEIYRNKKKLKLDNIKIIYGLEITINFEDLKIYSTLLAKNKKGLKKLYEIAKDMAENTSNSPYIDIEKIKDSRNDLVLGVIDFKRDLSLEIADTDYKKDILKKYYDYVEISQYFTKDDVLKIISVCRKLNKLVIATSYPEMLDKSQGLSLSYLYVEKSIGYFYYETRYYWSTDEMKKYFSYVDNIEEIIIDNPKKIADKIEDIELENDKIFASDENKRIKFKELVLIEANKHYSNHIPKDIKEVLEEEIENIIKDTKELYCGKDKYINDYEFVYLPESWNIKAIFPFMRDENYNLPVAKINMSYYCNIISFETYD